MTETEQTIRLFMYAAASSHAESLTERLLEALLHAGGPFSARYLAEAFSTYPATIKRWLSKVDLYQPDGSSKWFQLKTVKTRVGKRGPESTGWYLEEVK